MTHRPKRIMVADDDAAILDAMKMILEEEGYEVITATNGNIPELIAKTKPDMLLLDIWMSGHDGREICKMLKKHEATRDVPIVMVSANRDTEAIANACGADNFLAKPFDIDDLIQMAKRYTT